jgi:hypothetical protein
LTGAVTDAVFARVGAAWFVSGDDGMSGFFEATGRKTSCLGERRHKEAFAGAARGALDIFVLQG